jgi:glycosyltransferase involved in cell wall biosynthesis
MRIGLITGEYPPMQGGVGDYTQILAQHLADLGHDIFILTSSKGEESDPRLQLKAIGGWGPSSLWTITRWAHSNRLDVISLQFETAAYGMSPWIHFLPNTIGKIPIVTTFHDLLAPYLFPKAGKLRDDIVMRLAENSAGVVVTNHEDFQKLRRLPFSTLIPIGSNILTQPPADFDREAWRRRAGATEPGDFLMAYFGFINRSKGIEVLIEDMHAIRQRHDYPLKLVMIGGRTGASDPSNAEYVAEIDALVKALALEDFVHWTGFVDDEEVSAYLKACDVVVLPFQDGASYRRGTLMAAIWHGCAIVTTQPHVTIPLFADGENMILAQPEVISQRAPAFLHVSHGILRLYRSAELREHLRHGALQLARHFEWPAIARDHITFFERVIGATR